MVGFLSSNELKSGNYSVVFTIFPLGINSFTWNGTFYSVWLSEDFSNLLFAIFPLTWNFIGVRLSVLGAIPNPY